MIPGTGITKLKALHRKFLLRKNRFSHLLRSLLAFALPKTLWIKLLTASQSPALHSIRLTLVCAVEMPKLEFDGTMCWDLEKSIFGHL